MYTRGMRLGLLTTLSLPIALVLILPIAASAQSLLDSQNVSSFTVSANPQYPSPNSTVTLSFVSSSLNLANATLAVSVGGKNVYRGTVQPVAVTLGKAGSVTNVSATITAGGTPYTQTLQLQPQDVSLVVEPISSVPPFYPGKPLVPLLGDVRIVAVANVRNVNGKPLDPLALSYAWTVDDTKIADSSGIGKTTVMVASPLQYRARNVSVAVTSADGSLVGGDSFSLTSAEPSVRIYQNDPLLGIRFDRALSGLYAITGSESTLYAAPFSFATTDGPPLIQWFLSGSPAQTGNSITLKPTGTGAGNDSLSVTATSGSNTANADLSLSFGSAPSTNFFGL